MAAKKKEQTKALRVLEDWEKDLANEAKDEKARETQGVPRITHENGIFKIDGTVVAAPPGSKLGEGKTLEHIVIVDFKAAKEWYSKPYQPGVPAVPDCYAFGDDEKTLAPSPDVPDRQAETCAKCDKNVYGTATFGAGKACRDSRRLLVAMKPASVEAYAKVETRQLAIPPTSLKGWSNYLGSLKDTTRTGNVREALTQITIGPRPKGAGHQLNFTQEGALPPDQLKAVIALRNSNAGVLTQPYPKLDEKAAKPAAPARSAKSNRKMS